MTAKKKNGTLVVWRGAGGGVRCVEDLSELFLGCMPQPCIRLTKLGSPWEWGMDVYMRYPLLRSIPDGSGFSPTAQGSGTVSLSKGSADDLADMVEREAGAVPGAGLASSSRKL